MNTAKIIITAIIMLVAFNTTKARPSTAQRMKSGNSNGFSMNAWYGGKNKHKCGLHKTRTRSKQNYLKY